MFRAAKCSSSGESNCVNRSSGKCHSWYAGQGPAYQAVTSTEWYLPDDLLTQFDSPDDEHLAARNMYRSEVNKYIGNRVKLVIKNYTEMHGQRNIKCRLDIRAAASQN
jgi:hypothetical protein